MGQRLYTSISSNITNFEDFMKRRIPCRVTLMIAEGQTTSKGIHNDVMYHIISPTILNDVVCYSQSNWILKKSEKQHQKHVQTLYTWPYIIGHWDFWFHIDDPDNEQGSRIQTHWYTCHQQKRVALYLHFLTLCE